MGRRRAQLLFLLFASIITTNAIGSDLSSNDLINTGSLGGAVGAPGGGSTLKGSPVGTEHAPVDGRDGMPHDGPFVETSAERRKKQGTGDEEIMVKEPPKDHGDLPQTNDAVMDDRINSKPVDGTRGVEGGISDRSKEIKVSEKKPESPKDARPVPHSEVRDAAGSEGTAATTDEETKKPLAVSYQNGVDAH